MEKKVYVTLGLLVGLGTGLYFLYVQQPPPDDIIAANKMRHKVVATPAIIHSADEQNASPTVTVTIDPRVLEIQKVSEQWQSWIAENNYVSIGGVYDKCEGEDDRMMLGTVLLMKNPTTGGIMTRTVINATLEEDVFGGTVYVKTSYKGRELYKNQWDLCTDEDPDDQVVFCPVKAGRHEYVKDVNIPTYAPKGTYRSTTWLTDDTEKLLGCSVTEFTI